MEDTNNPIYYETREIAFEFNHLERAPPIILNIWDVDDDLFDSTDDFIGRAVVHLKDIPDGDLSTDDRIPYPVWWPVKYNQSDTFDKENGAAILCSFQLVDFDYPFQLPCEDIELNKPMVSPEGPLDMPKLDVSEFKTEIIVLGLRELVSCGLMPIRKAFVKFNLKSLLPGALAKAVENIQTTPSDPGPNPNLRTTI